VRRGRFQILGGQEIIDRRQSRGFRMTPARDLDRCSRRLASLIVTGFMPISGIDQGMQPLPPYRSGPLRQASLAYLEMRALRLRVCRLAVLPRIDGEQVQFEASPIEVAQPAFDECMPHRVIDEMR
jgi:hypothetical protein